MPGDWAVIVVAPEAGFQDSCRQQSYSRSCSSCGTPFSADPVIATHLEIEGKLFSAGLDDTAGFHHVHVIRHDIIEQPLVMCHQYDCIILASKVVHTTCNDPERIDIKTGIGLIKDCQSRFKQCHLQYFVSFLLSARKTFIDTAIKKIRVHFEQFHFLTYKILKLQRIQFLPSALRLYGIVCKAQEMTVGDAGYLDRILKSQKYAGTCTLLWLKIKQIIALECH